MFHIRRRPADMQPRKRKKKLYQTASSHAKEQPDDSAPFLLELRHGTFWPNWTALIFAGVLRSFWVRLGTWHSFRVERHLSVWVTCCASLKGSILWCLSVVCECVYAMKVLWWAIFMRAVSWVTSSRSACGIVFVFLRHDSSWDCATAAGLISFFIFHWRSTFAGSASAECCILAVMKGTCSQPATQL